MLQKTHYSLNGLFTPNQRSAANTVNVTASERNECQNPLKWKRLCHLSIRVACNAPISYQAMLRC